MFTLHSATTLKQPLQSVYSVLTDFDTYEQWVPSVRHSRTLVREGDILVAEFNWYSVLKDERFVLEIVQSPPHWVNYAQVDQFGQGGLSGSWELSPSDDGQETILRGKMTLRLPFYKVFAARRRIRRTLQGFGRGIAARTPAVADKTSSPAGTKLFELSRQNGKLRLWFSGEQYDLHRTHGA